MTKSRDSTSLPRREFLKTAGLLSGAAGVAAVTLRAGSAKAAAQAEKSAYRETKHVRKYYELARF